jgi:pimeloyl-ACP methyl ester carboxylesterase
VAILGVLVALLGAGILYQRVGLARHRRQFAPPGQLLDVNGHRLHVTCRGTGSPVVLLESGIAASSLSWSHVEPHVAKVTRVCAYDRAGLGWSDAPSCPRTFDRIVDDLATVLEHKAPREQYVLVGHSFGSFVVLGYAVRHPERVAGIVLVDPPVEWLTSTPHRARLLWGGRQLSRIGALLAHIGVVRACLALLTGGAPGAPRRFVKVFGPTTAQTLERLVGEVRKLPPDLYPVVQALWCDPKCFHAMGEHLLTLEREGARIGRVTPSRDLPLVVISSGDQPAERLLAHHTLSESSVHGRHLVARRSAHWVQFDEPELIVDVINNLLESHRAAEPSFPPTTHGHSRC